MIGYSQFGKNIVQYDEFDWNFIQTKHFDIYYYDPYKEQAEFVAYNVEQAYLKIEKILGWELSKRSDIFIYNSQNDFQQNNIIDIYLEEGVGGVTELIKNRMVIPFNGSLQEFKHVIYHELVHVFINDGIYGGSLLNMIKKSNISIPLWMNEGLAEYLANRWGTNSDMWIRDLSINYTEFPDIKLLNGYLAYRGGQSVWLYITSKWGEEIIAEIFHNIKIKNHIYNGLEESLGINIKELNEQWHQFLKEEYWGDIESRNSLNNIARKITDHEELKNNYNIAPAISPDGLKAAIYSNKDGEMSIYIISTLDGKFISKIATGQITSEYEELHILRPGISWSPNGEKIVFAAKSGATEALFIINVNNNKKIKKIINIEGIYSPAWHPSKNIIAFIGNNGKQSDIYLYDITEDNLQNLTDDFFSDLQVSWFPNGEELLFISDRKDNIIPKVSLDIFSLFEHQFDNNDIYKFNIKNNTIQRLTNTEFNESFPVSSPDGRFIGFISDESGINNIYITNDEFKTYYGVTNILTGITQLNWSSNNQIAFTGFYKAGYDIFILSNIEKFITNKIQITKTKWRKKKYTKLLRKSEKYEPSKNQDLYKNYNFNNNRSASNSTKFTIKNEFLLDSLGHHKPFKYNTKFTLDYAGGYFTYDILEDQGQGMGAFIFSDLLGNHRIALQTSLQIDFKLSDFYFYYNNLKNRINWRVSLYNYAYAANLSIIDDYTYAFELFKDINLGLQYKYPFSKFHRLEWGANYNYLQKGIENINELTNIDSSKKVSSYHIFEPYINYVWDNTRNFYIYTVDGSKAAIKYSISPDINTNSFNFQKLTIDTRNYKEISFDKKISFASRVFIGTSWGDNARVFGIGGAGSNTFFLSDNYLLNQNYIDNVIYNPETDEGTEYEFWSMNNLESPVRGYNFGQKYGKNTIIMNFEFRLPFLIYYLPSVKFLGQLFGVIFIDIGAVWNDHFLSMPDFSNKNNWDLDSPVGWIMSYGFGPRFTLFGMPWKLDYAWQYNPYSGKVSSKKWYLSVGFDF